MKRVWLVKLRKNKGFTHNDVGGMVGISRQSYTLIEGGTRNPSLLTALKLSATLGFDPILFLDNSYSLSKHKGAIQPGKGGGLG